MKWFGCILPLYLLILSGFTCNAADDCCMDEARQESPAKHDDDKPAGPCIPFLACGACYGILAPQISLAFPQPFLFERKLYFFYSEASFTTAASAFWQPPQKYYTTFLY